MASGRLPKYRTEPTHKSFGLSFHSFFSLIEDPCRNPLPRMVDHKLNRINEIVARIDPIKRPGNSSAFVNLEREGFVNQGLRCRDIRRRFVRG